MIYLIVVTLIWACSFSLISEFIAGSIDSYFAVFIRIAIAFILFIPFLKLKPFTFKNIITLMIIGSLQLSIMYVFYYTSFNYINVPEILLFTIFTPFYITLFYDLYHYKKIRLFYILTAFICILGTAVIRYQGINSNFVTGFLLIQGANIVFALGQTGYKLLMERHILPQHNAFSWFYLGALITSSIIFLLLGNFEKMPTANTQWLTLIWLGAVASGICYFLWNYGATKVDSGVLVCMNNAVIPVGILVNVLIFKAQIDWIRFIIGSLIMISALLFHYYMIKKNIH